MNPNNNVFMVQEVARGLGPLCDRVVFVGGATTSLYIDDSAAPQPSASDDVDLVVEITTLIDYNKFEKELAKQGFKPPNPMDGKSPPICRKFFNDIQVDIMPISESILGFSNPWYAEAVKQKESKVLPDGTSIFLFSPAYFLASKLVAFENRSPKDIRQSQDLEDIFAVLDGCSRIEESLEKCSQKARSYVVSVFKRLLKNRSILEEAGTASLGMSFQQQTRATNIVNRIAKIVEL